VSFFDPHDATLLQASEQLKDIFSHFSFIGTRIPLQQIVDDGGHGPFSIEAREDVTRWATQV
jgi:hypothetical protein